MHQNDSTPGFTQLNANEHSCTLGFRTDARAGELYDEATLRQTAALDLLCALSGATNLNELQADCLSGCFQAIRILCSDTAALHTGAYEAIARETATTRTQLEDGSG
jgi:hypothetical protein